MRESKGLDSNGNLLPITYKQEHQANVLKDGRGSNKRL